MRRLPVFVLVMAAMLAAITPGALGAQRLVRVGQTPRLPAGTRLVGAVPRGQALHVTVALAPRTPAALAQYAHAVSDPASRLFHRFLTPARFVARFAPTRAQVDAVLASLRRRGLSPGPVSADRLAIPIEGSAAVIERAFSVSLAEVRLPNGSRGVVSVSPPAIDAPVAGLVQSVVGLDSLSSPTPVSARRPVATRPAASSRGAVAPQAATGGPDACATARADAPSNSAYTSDQIASAYEFSGLLRGGDKGRGVTVAVYELEPDAPSDIATYQSCYGTHASVKYVKVDGGAGSGAGSGEAALDIEQLIGLAPRSRLLVYQGPNSDSGSPGAGPYDVYNAIVSQDRASVVSTSWGVCEPLQGQSAADAENTLFEEAALQGQTVLAASGDSGSEGYYGSPLPDPQLAVEDPASQPFVTGVGGTSLTRLGPPPSESTWNDSLLLGGAEGAGGGGISSLWSMPVYQRRAPSSLGVIGANSSGSPCGASSGDCREVPDVSADADPNTGYLIYYNGSGSETGAEQGWQGIGGTSGAAPLWAALVALADANPACARERLGFVNPTLYRLAGQDQDAYFNDVTTGNNDYTGTSGGLYPARPGYDMATGLGTPKASALAPALCRQGLRLASPGARSSVRHRRTSLRLHVSDARHAGLRLTVRGLPPGLHLHAASRRITGRTKRTGTYHVTLRATDSDGAIRSVHFVWTVKRR
jgi:subtilase family serine protease